MQTTRNVLAKYAAPVIGAVAALSSFVASAAIDVTGVVSEIDATKTPIGDIGVAVLLVIVALAAFAFVRKAIRG